LAWSGLSIHVVQQLAGRSKIAPTKQLCVSLQPEDLAKALERVWRIPWEGVICVCCY
jgi:hypothetical protein